MYNIFIKSRLLTIDKISIIVKETIIVIYYMFLLFYKITWKVISKMKIILL